MDDRVRIAVVGYGCFGQVHAKRLRAHPAFDLVCVVDTDRGAQERARLHGFQVIGDIAALPVDVTAAAVVTPASTHSEIAIALLQRGVHVLVEKPMTESIQSLESMLEAARKVDRMLMVGHIERFNRVLTAQNWDREPQRISFFRQSRVSGTARSVVLDLMVHDIDLVSYMLRSPSDTPFEVADVQVQRDAVYVDARIGAVGVSFFARHGANVSQASVRWQKGHTWHELLLSSPPDIRVADAMTQQYAAFRSALNGHRSQMATALDGALAVRRALSIVDLL